MVLLRLKLIYALLFCLYAVLSAVAAAAGVSFQSPTPPQNPSSGRGLSHATGMRTLFYQIVSVAITSLVGGDGGYL